MSEVKTMTEVLEASLAAEPRESRRRVPATPPTGLRGRIVHELPDLAPNEVDALAERARLTGRDALEVVTRHGWMPALPVWVNDALGLAVEHMAHVTDDDQAATDAEVGQNAPYYSRRRDP